MKQKQVSSILLTAFIVLMVSGCGSTAPKFFLNPPIDEDAFYGVGTAKKESRSLAKKTATGRARDEVANAVEIKVNNMLKDFMQESGVGDNAQALEFTESVSKQVSSIAMKGCKIIQAEEAKDRTFYVLVQYRLQDAIDASINEAKKEEALFNEFKARQGFDSLEKELRKLDTAP